MNHPLPALAVSAAAGSVEVAAGKEDTEVVPGLLLHFAQGSTALRL